MLNAPKFKGSAESMRRIDETETSEHGNKTLGGTSWADLSLTVKERIEGDDYSKASTLSRDKRMHLSKRWQSLPAISTGMGALKSPKRESDISTGNSGATTPGKFTWLKKKMAFIRKQKHSDTAS
jgi:hypothetical protein